MQKDNFSLIFDLGGVYFTDGTNYAIKTISKKYNLDIKDVEDIFYSEIGLKYREDRINMMEFWDYAKNAWKIGNENTQTLAEIWHKGYIPNDKVVELIVALKAKGLDIFFLSGSTRERVVYLEKSYNFLKNFKDGVFTYEVGVRKPSLQPYLKVLEKTANISEMCIFIDNKESYLTPASELGMKTILFDNPYSLYRKFVEMKIL